MASANTHSHIGTGLLAVTATAVMLWFGNGLDPWWPLMWFAPLPVLLFSLQSSRRATASVAFIAWFAGGMNMWRYMHAVLGSSLLKCAASVSALAVVFMGAVLLFRGLARRGAWWSALAAFPAAWVTLEYLLNLSSPHGTAGSLAYTQLKCLPFLQLASLTGPWGMSFLLLLFPATVALSWYLRRTCPKQAWRTGALGFGVIAAVFLFGAVRLATRVPGEEIKAGLIASDLPQNANVTAEGPDTERLFQEYAGVARRLSLEGAQVIVIPEKLGVVADPARTDAIFQSLANETKAVIVAGMVRVLPPLSYNQARVYAPEAPVLAYDKHHMLPPFESKLTPGRTLTMLQEPSGIWGVEICKDMDFTPLSREYGRAGAGLMLVPAWDFVLDASWHGHMALMRAVEGGFSLVRAAKDGYLTVSDDRGRVLAEASSGSAPYATLLARVPVAHENTLYLMLGDWFGWTALVIFALVLVSFFRVRKRAADESP